MDIEGAVASLQAVYESRVPLPPLTSTFPDLSLATAYQVQLAWVQARLDRGHVVKGHKVGLTSLAMQRQLGVGQPDFGHLMDDMFFDDGGEIPSELLLQPRIEPEIAFVLKRELRGPGIILAEAAAAVKFVLPALEIIDSRVADWKITIADTIADNASSGLVVLGNQPRLLHELNLRLTGVVLEKNGHVVATGAGGAVLGDPVVALAWLANTVGEHGGALEQGHVVLTGSCTKAVIVDPGDVVSGRFAGIGSVSTRFSAAGGSS